MSSGEIRNKILFPVIAGTILWVITAIIKRTNFLNLIRSLGQTTTIEIRIILIIIISTTFLVLLTIIIGSQFIKFRIKKTNTAESESRKGITKELQIEGSITIKCDCKPYDHIEISKLKQSDEQEKLILTWETFVKGLEYLTKKIKGSSASRPNIIFGINETGIMMASYLSFKLMR